MPGSPAVNAPNQPASIRPRHPAAFLLFALAAGVGLAFARDPIVLGVATLALAWLALRAEGRRPRHEIPFWTLALILFFAHALLGRFEPTALRAAAALALRLLALVYLTRWAVRTFLPGAAHWLLGLPIPRRPRFLLLGVESARLAATLLPLAAREAEAQTLALRARGIRGGRGLGGRARFLAAWLLPFLATMLRLGDSLGDALHARGYVAGARRAGGPRPPWAAPDAALVLGGLVVAGVLIRGV